MSVSDELLRRQKVLSEFGEFVLDASDLQSVLDESCRLVAEALDADLAKILQIERGANTALIRAGVGWNDGIVGQKRIDLGDRSSEAYAVETSQPVITQDIACEERFEFPGFMRDHGVISLVNVPIFLHGRRAWGVLQVDDRKPRNFDEHDIEFLKTYSTVLGPVIDRLETVVELRHTDERLRLILQNARNYVIVLSDENDRITDWLAGSEDILGWKAEEIIGQPTSTIFTPEDQEHGVPELELQRALEGGAAPNVRWHLRQDGTRVFLDGQTIVLREDSEIRGFLKIGQDVTQRKLGEERQAVLLAELQHRVRNVLTVVRSLISRTVRGATSVDEVKAQLEGRIDALARTQALLTRAPGVGVLLHEIIEDELAAQGADSSRFTIKGQPVELAPKAAEVITLAIHELATNAVKYGALRHEGGELAVSWTVDTAQMPPWLRIKWRERNLNNPAAAERRIGFGTELVTRRVPYELRGRGQLEVRANEVDAAIEFPLVTGASILETGAPS